MKKVLIAACNHWTSPLAVGTHHLANRFLEAGWQVGYVSAPLTPLHLLLNCDFKERWALHKRGGRVEHDGRLWTYTPFGLMAPTAKPFFRSGFVARNWHRTTLPSLARLARKKGFGQVDLLFFDHIFQGFWLNAVEYDRSVLRIRDRTDAFSDHGPALKQAEKNLARHTDLTVYTARTLLPYIKELGSTRTLFMPNGVDLGRFQGPMPPLPEEYADIPEPRVVYTGTLAEWLDTELVNQAAARLPHVSFVLVGPPGPATPRITKAPNVHHLGMKPHDQLAAYLRHAQAGIIPFDVKGFPDLIHAVNPLKLYEYAACGLPTASVAWKELELINGPVYLSRDTDGFVANLETILAKPLDDAAKAELERFAQKHDWKRIFSSLTDYLETGELPE